jgi:hypothetical protein
MINTTYTYNIIILSYLFVLSYIFNYYLLEYISINIYSSILTSLLIISILDGFNLLNERDNLNIEYENIYKLLELQIIENKKLETAIKLLKKR